MNPHEEEHFQAWLDDEELRGWYEKGLLGVAGVMLIPLFFLFICR